jgi:hypothetical protein
MPHYCTIDDVNALVPQAPFTTTSRPTIAQVEGVIEQVADRIDATIGNVGYTVPVVTGARALTLLSEACAWGALGMAQTIRGTAVQAAVGDKGEPSENIWTRKFEKWLKALTSPSDPFELPDAPRTSEQLLKQPVELVRSHVLDDTERFVTDPVITRYQVL